MSKKNDILIGMALLDRHLEEPRERPKENLRYQDLLQLCLKLLHVPGLEYRVATLMSRGSHILDKGTPGPPVIEQVPHHILSILVPR